MRQITDEINKWYPANSQQPSVRWKAKLILLIVYCMTTHDKNKVYTPIKSITQNMNDFS